MIIKNLDYYNIHGLVCKVEGEVRDLFKKEYGRFLVENYEDLDCVISVEECQKCAPFELKPKGEKLGARIDVIGDKFILRYNKGASPYFILSMFEGLMLWPDKTLLHAGGISSSKGAFVFTGKGNVGKTSLVLQGINRGYKYLGDDWLVVGNGLAYPLPKRIRVFDYNIVFDKETARKIIGRNYLKYFFIISWFYTRKLLSSVSPHPYLKRALNVLRPIFNVDITELNPLVEISDPTPIRHVLFLERKYIEKIKIDKISSDEVALKMAAYNFFERNFFWQLYFLNVFNYGGFNKSDLLCKEFFKQQGILKSTFDRTSVFRVVIPKSMPPKKLWKILESEGLITK